MLFSDNVKSWLQISIVMVCVFIGSCSMTGAVIYRLERYKFDSRPKIENHKCVLIYIDKTPPTGMKYVKWHNLIIASLREWFEPAGCSLAVIKDESKAQIRFKVNQLPQDRWGQAQSHNPYKMFPLIPYPEDEVTVEIQKDILYMPGHDIRRTLLHEIGHTIGLGHRKNSIMSNDLPKPSRLTDLDYKSIIEYKMFIERY